MRNPMINAVALGLLLSYLGAVVFLFPESQLNHADNKVLLQKNSQPPEKFTAAQQAAASTLSNLAGSPPSKPPSTIEQLKQKLHVGYEKTAQGMGNVQDSSKDVLEKSKQGLQDKASDAYSSIPSKDEAASYIPGRHQARDTLETLKNKLENSQQDMQEAMKYFAASGKDGSDEALESLKEKLEDSQTGMQHSIHDAAKYFHSDRDQDFTENADEVFEEVKERLSAAEEQKKKKFSWFRKKPQGEGEVLTGRVQEFCNWFVNGSLGSKETGGGGGRVQQVSEEAKESYRLLTDAAKGAIEAARDVFEKAVVAEAGGGVEWRERYAYLAFSAKGAVEGSREVFERVVAGTRISRVASEPKMQGWATDREDGNVTAVGTRIKRVAKHTTERLTAGVHALLRTLYLAIFSIVFGVSLWMTFVSGHLVAGVPRHQVVAIQSRLFPVYLRCVSIGLAMCLAIHAVLNPWFTADHPERWQYANFTFTLATCLLNTFVVEPKATKAMFEKLKLEKEEGSVETEGGEVDENRKAQVAKVNANVKDMHAFSSSLNMLSVGGLAWHLWYLANRLQV